MRLPSILVGAFVTCMLLFSTASAEMITYTIDDIEGTITVTAAPQDLGYGEAVTVLLVKTEQDESEETATLRRQKTLSQLKSEELLMAYVQGITAKDGKFTTEIALDQRGDYTLIVVNPQTGVPEEKSFYYSTRDNKITFIKETASLLSAEGADPSVLEAKLNLERKEKSDTARNFDISGSNNVVFRVSESGLADTFFNLLKNEAKDEKKDIKTYIENMTPETFVEKLTLSAQLTSMTEGLGTVMDYSGDFSPASDYVETYNSKVTDAEKAEFAKYFKGKKFYSKTDALDCFYESVCLSVITKNSGWGNYQYLIETHGSDMGITRMDEYNKLKNPVKVTDYLTGKYTTVEAFAKAVDNGIKELTSGGKGSGSSGGGGKGGFSGSVGNVIEKDPGKASAPQTIVRMFKDTDDVSWAVESIEALAKANIVAGVGDGYFEPERNVKREEFVKMAVLAAGLQVEKNEIKFIDVKDGEWYCEYISPALENGIITGISEDMFGIGENITRQDAAVILFRIAEKAGKVMITDETLFSDDNNIADYAKEAVYSLKYWKVINGRDGNEFCPEDSLSRAEAAKMIYGLMQKM